MAVPRESWVILADLAASLIGDRVLASRQNDSVLGTYVFHLPTTEKPQE